MRVLFLVLLLPTVFAAPAEQKRVLLDTLGGSIFDLETLRCDIQIMVDLLGSDPTEVACESECHNLLQEGHVFNYACPLVCHGFQTLLHSLNVTPDPSGTAKPCTTPTGRK